MNKNKNVIIYARVTSVENDPHVYTKLDKQLELCRTYCEENNLDVMTELRSFGPEMKEQSQALIQYLQSDDAKRLNLDTVVVSDLDRISRHSAILASFEKALEEMGMNLHIACSQFAQELAALMTAEYSKQFSNKIKAGIARKKRTA